MGHTHTHQIPPLLHQKAKEIKEIKYSLVETYQDHTLLIVYTSMSMSWLQANKVGNKDKRRSGNSMVLAWKACLIFCFLSFTYYYFSIFSGS